MPTANLESKMPSRSRRDGPQRESPGTIRNLLAALRISRSRLEIRGWRPKSSGSSSARKFGARPVDLESGQKIWSTASKFQCFASQTRSTASQFQGKTGRFEAEPADFGPPPGSSHLEPGNLECGQEIWSRTRRYGIGPADSKCRQEIPNRAGRSSAAVHRAARRRGPTGPTRRSRVEPTDPYEY